MQWWTLPNHMELEPEHDEPEVDPQEVLDVLFGLADKDSVGRDFSDLMNDTAIGTYHEELAFHHHAEKAFFHVMGANWHRFPKEVREVFERLAAKAAEEL